MQITINDKKIAEALGIMLDDSLFNFYDKDLLKAANTPKRAEIIKSVMADKKFQAKMAKAITHYATDIDVLVDQVYDVDSTIVTKLVYNLDEVFEEVSEATAKKADQAMVKDTIARLESMGYKVTKV